MQIWYLKVENREGYCTIIQLKKTLKAATGI